MRRVQRGPGRDGQQQSDLSLRSKRFHRGGDSWWKIPVRQTFPMTVTRQSSALSERMNNSPPVRSVKPCSRLGAERAVTPQKSNVRVRPPD